jgi:hypothetical protein
MPPTPHDRLARRARALVLASAGLAGTDLVSALDLGSAPAPTGGSR